MENTPKTMLAAQTLVQTGGMTPSSAARQLGVSERTVRQWAQKEGWEKATPPTQNRLKSPPRSPLSVAKPVGRNRSQKAGPVGSKKRGAVHLAEDWCWPAVEDLGLYPYQAEIAALDERTVLWLKSRQIGASTHVIPARALRRGLTRGYDQLFLSNARDQVEMLGDCVRNLGTRLTGVEWLGNKRKIEVRQAGNIVCTFRFLTAKSNLGQGFTGDVYIDEAAWIEKLDKVAPLAMGMATLRGYTRFLASSAGPPESYFMYLFKGEAPLNGKKIKATRIKTTVYDAIAGGNPHLDVKLLREECSPAEFKRLYECSPWENEASVFSLARLRACQTTHALVPQPGDCVWVGYDPARTIDYACAVVAGAHEGRLHLVKCLLWKKRTSRQQANSLKELALQYNVQEFAMDITGYGKAVADEALELGLPVRQIHYSLERKNDLVMRMRGMVDRQELGFPATEENVINSFLAIKQTGTPGGKVTYTASRTAQTGHAEAFWAFSHAAEIAPVGKKANSVQVF